MKKTTLAAMIAAAMTTSTPAMADMIDVAKEIAAMKARIAQLETQLAEQQASNSKLEANNQTQSNIKNNGFSDNVEVSGVLELVAFHSDTNGESDSESDVEVDTFELGIGAKLNEKVSVSTLLEYNSDDKDIELTEAYATIAAGPTTITAGLAPIPVAAINDTGWTSPLTDDFFDIKEGTAMLHFGNEQIAADIYAFNNDDDDSLNSLGASISANVAQGITLGAGYVSDLSDADFADLTTKAKDAWRLNALAELGAITLSAEYLKLDGEDADPNFLALNAAFGTERATYYLGWSEIADANQDLERTVLGVERGFGENATVSAEYIRDEEDGIDTDTVNLVLVTEF